MKRLIAFLFCFSSSFCFSQNQTELKSNENKGKYYVYWGWNWSWYTRSDLHFTGNNYDFELSDVVAKDRQSKFDLNTYFNPAYATIPQYNVRIGYYFNEKYNISIGTDHMKYVVQANQEVKINGNIKSSGTEYDGSYLDNDIKLTTDFLQLEHTDGLNYSNVELRRIDNIFSFKKVKLSVIEGFGIGTLIPKTNATLMNNKRYDEFHFAGFGLGGVAAVNIMFFDCIFIQSELKGGYISMPDIRTTMNKADRASQHFFFTQANVVFGAKINFKNRNGNGDVILK